MRASARTSSTRSCDTSFLALASAALAAATLLDSARKARTHKVGPFEEQVFRLVNDAPDGAHLPLWAAVKAVKHRPAETSDPEQASGACSWKAVKLGERAPEAASWSNASHGFKGTSRIGVVWAPV